MLDMTSTALKSKPKPSLSSKTAENKARVAQRLIEAMESGNIPWKPVYKPGVANPLRPRSVSTGKLYRGVNVLLLAVEAMSNGYQSQFWATYDQWAKLCGYSIKVGQGRFSYWTNEHGDKWTGLANTKGTQITFWKRLVVDNPKAGQPGEKDKKVIPFLQIYYVWNADQVTCETLPERYRSPEAEEIEPIAAAQAVIDGYKDGPQIVSEDQVMAWYAPARDTVNVPRPENMVSTEAWYLTTFHELGHSTGHTSRLGREGIEKLTPHRQGTLYSFEELVAEMTSAFLAGTCGLDSQANIDNSAAYLRSWIKYLKDDPDAAMRAAGQAQKAADHILGITWEEEEAV